jgi:hypothetical protein
MQPDDDLAARLYEAVADDEVMRGDLTDEGYGAILGWAEMRAVHLATYETDVSFDSLADALRAAVRALVLAAERGNPTELTGIDPMVATPAAVAAITAALVNAPDDRDSRAQAMAAAPIDSLAS